jgi:hypothetical protein
VRTFTSLHRRRVVTESGLDRGLLEHFGIGGQASATPARVRDTDVIPWTAVVRLERDRIVVHDPAS